MMRHLNRLTLLLILLILSSLSSVHAASARDEVAGLVRALGYGAGIHHFKNYVLRGRTEYYASAKRSLADALTRVNQLEKDTELNQSEQQAVVTIKAMVMAYDSGLDTVSELRTKGWRLDDVDLSVAINDADAIAALDLLRSKWKWSELEEIEYQLGYGQGIHNFKNYVIRQHERYHTLALANFLAVESLIVNQFNNTKLGSTDKEALESIERVVQSYRNYLTLIGRLHTMQKPVRQIDLAVKINDKPAVEGFALLNK